MFLCFFNIALVTFSQLIVVSVLKKVYFVCLFVLFLLVLWWIYLKADGYILRLSSSAVFLESLYGCGLIGKLFLSQVFWLLSLLNTYISELNKIWEIGNRVKHSYIFVDIICCFLSYLV